MLLVSPTTSVRKEQEASHMLTIVDAVRCACSVLGRNSAPHDAVCDVLSHLVVQNSVTDAAPRAAVVETRLAAADGSTYDADVVDFDLSSARFILEVSIVTIGSGTSLDCMRSMRSWLKLRAREEKKRNHDIVRKR